MKPESIEIPIWWSNGNGMSYRRDALPLNHPESQYSYIKNVLGLNPSDYDEKYKAVMVCPHCGLPHAGLVDKEDYKSMEADKYSNY